MPSRFIGFYLFESILIAAAAFGFAQGLSLSVK